MKKQTQTQTQPEQTQPEQTQKPLTAKEQQLLTDLRAGCTCKREGSTTRPGYYRISRKEPKISYAIGEASVKRLFPFIASTDGSLTYHLVEASPEPTKQLEPAKKPARKLKIVKAPEPEQPDPVYLEPETETAPFEYPDPVYLEPDPEPVVQSEPAKPVKKASRAKAAK